MKDPASWIHKSDDIDIEKHNRERQERGFSWNDWINFDSYLSWVIVNGLNMFLEQGHGHPPDLTEETWNDSLRKMVAAFEGHLKTDDYTLPSAERKEAEEAWDEGSELFIKYFRSLWD